MANYSWLRGANPVNISETACYWLIRQYDPFTTDYVQWHTLL